MNRKSIWDNNSTSIGILKKDTDSNEIYSKIVEHYQRETSRKLDTTGPPRIRNFHSRIPPNLHRYLARIVAYQQRPIRLW